MDYVNEQCLWRKILEKYSSFKFLWNEDKRANYSQTECDRAWRELVDMFKEIQKEADKTSLQTRINLFHTFYEREKKKVEAAEKSGEKYEPTVYYYDIFKSMSDELDDKQHNSRLNAVRNSIDSSLGSDDTYITIKKANDGVAAEEEEHKSITEPMTTPILRAYDTARLLVQRMAEHFELMDTNQALIAEKIISDICVNGRLQQLSLGTRISLN